MFRHRRYLILILPLLMAGCSLENNSATVNVSPRGWYGNDARIAVYDNTDTLGLRRISIFAVHDDSFVRNHDSLRLTLTTIAPDSTSVTEHITITPAADNGNGFTESVYAYRSDALLGQSGIYSFTFHHTETIPVKGIKAVGVRID